MSGPLLGITGIAVMFVALFLLRIPAGFIMAIVGFFGLAYATSFTAALGMIGGEMWNLFSGYGLTVIPMFILVGEFVHYAGYNDSLYHATNRWFGHYRGGLAITTIMACAAFSAISSLFFGIVAWQVSLWGMRIAASGEVSETLKVIYYPFVFCVAVGFGLLALTCLMELLRELRKGEEAL